MNQAPTILFNKDLTNQLLTLLSAKGLANQAPTILFNKDLTNQIHSF